MSIRLFFFISILHSISSFGQIEQTGNLEMNLAENESDQFLTFSLGANGIIIARRGYNSTETVIELIRLDTTLREVWRGFISLELGLANVSTKVMGKKLFMLFKMQSSTRPDLRILEVDVFNGNYIKYVVNNFIPINLTDFVVTNKSAFIGGYFNYRPLVIHFDFQTQKSKVLPGLLNEQGELNQIKANEDGTTDVLITAKNYEKRKCLWVRSYDQNGNLLKNMILEPEKRKNFIFGRSVKTDSAEQIIAGVYGRFADYSRGIFVSRVNPYGEYETKYYNFADLQNFFKYLKARKAKRIKDRIERRKMKGQKIKFNYRFLVDEVVPYGDQIILLGEAFFPHYSYRSRSFGPMASSYYTYGSRSGDLIFDGFEYTHAVVIGFDKAGNLIWDNSFAINGIRSFQLEQFVKMGPYKDKMILLYTLGNSVQTKIISRAAMEEAPEKVYSKSKSAQLQETPSGKIEPWYDQHYFMYGVKFEHRDKDKTGTGRKVFFINKLSLK